jgi:hypothetical protein
MFQFSIAISSSNFVYFILSKPIRAWKLGSLPKSFLYLFTLLWKLASKHHPVPFQIQSCQYEKLGYFCFHIHLIYSESLIISLSFISYIFITFTFSTISSHLLSQKPSYTKSYPTTLILKTINHTINLKNATENFTISEIIFRASLMLISFFLHYFLHILKLVKDFNMILLFDLYITLFFFFVTSNFSILNICMGWYSILYMLQSLNSDQYQFLHKTEFQSY